MFMKKFYATFHIEVHFRSSSFRSNNIRMNRVKITRLVKHLSHPFFGFFQRSSLNDRERERERMGRSNERFKKGP